MLLLSDFTAGYRGNCHWLSVIFISFTTMCLYFNVVCSLGAVKKTRQFYPT